MIEITASVYFLRFTSFTFSLNEPFVCPRLEYTHSKVQTRDTPLHPQPNSSHYDASLLPSLCIPVALISFTCSHRTRLSCEGSWGCRESRVLSGGGGVRAGRPSRMRQCYKSVHFTDAYSIFFMPDIYLVLNSASLKHRGSVT